MKLVIFGGTTEGRELSQTLAKQGARVTVCVATDYGREIQGDIPGVTVLTGRQTAEEMVGVLRGAGLCVDATHPYAVEVSRNVKLACRKLDIPYERLLRKEEKSVGMLFDCAADAGAYLAETEGNILLTTGAKELSDFSAVERQRLYVRVLPSVESIETCMRAAIPRKNIIAMQGPFSTELNLALLRQYAIRFLVTKESGAVGGFGEKCRAAEMAPAELVVIRRPEEQGTDYSTVLSECEEVMQCR